MPEGLAQRIEKSSAATKVPEMSPDAKPTPTAKDKIKRVSRLIKFVGAAMGKKQDPAHVKAEIQRLKSLATQLTAEEERFLKV
jgi:hypothetical protein